MTGNDEQDPSGPDDASIDSDDASTNSDECLPEAVVESAVRLTRHAREAADDAEARAYREHRESLLETHEYSARVREEDEREVLVLHPAEWIEDETVRLDRVEDVDRAVEVPLSGPGQGDWEQVETHNRGIAETVAADHGDPHGATAHALADFAGNHYAKRIEDLSAGELEVFREDYLPRNAWPTDAQREALEESIRIVYATANARLPGTPGE